MPSSSASFRLSKGACLHHTEYCLTRALLTERKREHSIMGQDSFWRSGSPVDIGLCSNCVDSRIYEPHESSPDLSFLICKMEITILMLKAVEQEKQKNNIFKVLRT